jgi:hypothetical protein
MKEKPEDPTRCANFFLVLLEFVTAGGGSDGGGGCVHLRPKSGSDKKFHLTEQDPARISGIDRR